MAKQSEDSRKQNFTFRIDPELVKRFDRAAESEDRSRTNLIERLMRLHVEEYERLTGHNRT